MPAEQRTQRNDLAAEAIVYAEAGTAIIPLWWPTTSGRSFQGGCACPLGDTCPNAGKHPLTVNGIKDATVDVATVSAWWSRWPKANIGVAMTDDVFVIDVDPHNSGDETWLELTANGGQVWTRTSLSGRGDGGRHLWLRHPGVKMKGRLGPGVDVKRIPNAYVVAPPSIHFATMNPYTWVDPATPIAIPPTWLVDQLREPRAERSARRGADAPTACSFGRWNPGGLLYFMGQAVEGSRNSTLFWCAARIGDDVAAGKVREQRALEVLDVLAEIAESTGLSSLEVERTIRSGYRR